jgi:hypothetical protein
VNAYTRIPPKNPAGKRQRSDLRLYLHELTDKYLIPIALPEERRLRGHNIVILFHLYSLYFYLTASSV